MDRYWFDKRPKDSSRAIWARGQMVGLLNSLYSPDKTISYREALDDVAKGVKLKWNKPTT